MNYAEKEKIFTEIIEQNKNQIHRICWGFTINPFDIKDLYQEVIVNIWKGLEGFRNQSSYATWIHRITINTCLLWKKKTNYFNRPKVENQSLHLHPYEELVIEEDPQLLRLKHAISQLKSVDKTIILLVLEELTHKEISNITGLSVTNIGVKISRIKTHLKKLMEKKYPI